MFQIRPGEQVLVDGKVLEGRSLVDESSVAGEPAPVERQKNDRIISGSINNNGTLKVVSTRSGDQSTIAQIARLIEEAQNSKNANPTRGGSNCRNIRVRYSA
ncbi:hypothetical protein ACFFK0_15360 [Paenibacillus chartarius]|uniref:P-type ATPase A domain-containing protein n=1 Tax=Paenibacillus chartarius TaxID=747481 RepID=A0ABV6DME1_9BACL